MKKHARLLLLLVLWLIRPYHASAIAKNSPEKNLFSYPSGESHHPVTTSEFNLLSPLTNDPDVCEGDVEEYTYPATPGYVYIWNVTSGTGTPSGNTFTVTWGSPGSGTVTLIVKDAQGAVVDLQSWPVTIHSKPHPFITASFSPTCEKRDKETPGSDCIVACDSSIVVYSTPFNPGSTYTWTVVGANSFTPGANTVSVYWGAPGTGLIRVEETNVHGCTNAYEKCVTIIESPTAFFTSVPAAVGGVINICYEQSIQFYDASTGSIISPLMGWFWDFGDGGTSIGQNPSHTFTNILSDSYDVVLYVENECHCKDSFTVKVVVSNERPPKIECISTVCANGVDHYHTPSGAGCPGAVYNWNVVGGVITTPMPYGPDIDVQWGASGPGIVSLQMLGCPGYCSTPASVVVSIISPTTTISGPNPACQNSLSTYAIPTMPGCVYTWTVTGGFIMSGEGTEQVEVKWFDSTTGTISVTYENPTLYCSGSASMTVNLTLPFALSGPLVACSGSSRAYNATPGTPAENAAYNWTITNASNVVVGTSGGSDVYNINWSFGPGIYQITVTNGSGAFCNSPQSYFVTVYDAPPPPTFITGADPVCPGGSYMYTSAPTVPGTSIRWAVTNGTPVTANGNQLSVTWNAVGPYILSVSQVSMAFPNCPSAPFIDTIDSKMPPTAYNILGPHTICKNSIQSYSASSTAGDEYTWSIDSAEWGSVISGQGTPDVTIQWNNNAGAVFLNLRVKTCGVTTKSSVSITLTNTPAPTITGPAFICETDDAVFSTTTPGSGYSWDWGDGSPLATDTNSPPPHIYTTPGTYSVTLTVTDPYGCAGQSTAVQLIDVKPVPDAFITGAPKLYCPAGSTVNSPLYVTSLLQPGDTVNWFNGSAWVGGGPTHTATSAGIYTAVVTNMFGCSTTSNVIPIIVLHECPVPCLIYPSFLNFTAVKNGCLTYDFSGNISANGRLLGWKFDDLFDTTGSTSLTPSHTYSEPGVYRVIFSGRFPRLGSPGDSCDRDTFMDIIVPIKAKFGYEITCGGAGNYLVNFLDLSTFIGTHTLNSWTWTFPGGTPISSTAQNPTGVSFPAGSTSLVTLTITSVAGDSCTIQLPVTVPDIPMLNILGPDSTCQGNPVLFTDSLLTGVVNSWSWDFGDGASSLLHPTTRTYSTPGLTTVTLTITDQFGCTGVFTKNIFVNRNRITAYITTLDTTTFCAGQSALISASSNAAAAPVSYLWNTVDITSEITATQTGAYWVEITDARGCHKRSNTINILVNNVPQAMITGDNEYCDGETTLLSAFQGTSYTYEWLIDGMPSVSGSTFSEEQLPGTYNFQVIITDPLNGCKDTSAVYPVVVDSLPPPPGVGSDPISACEGSAVTLTATTGISPHTFNWSTGDAGNSIVVYNAGIYTATLTDQHGCESERSIRVYEMPDFSNLLQGCYEFCDSAPVTLIGPLGIGWTYQWFQNGVAIAGTAGTMKDLVIPADSSGIYELEITTGSPAYCSYLSGPIDVNFIHCQPCKADWGFRNITCVIDSNGTKVYYFSFILNNQYGPGATYNITTPGGYLTGLSPVSLVSGPNTITGFFVDVPPANNQLCITGTLYYGEKERCVLNETCTTLPYCEPPPRCDAKTEWLSMICAGSDANGNQQYYFDIAIDWPGSNGSAILSLTSPVGTITNSSINDLNNGSNILSGIFTFTNTTGTDEFCFEMYVMDPSTGRICYISDCMYVPKCGETDDCRAHTIELKDIWCDGFDINGNRTYKIDFNIINPFGSNASVYFTSPDGGLIGFTPGNIPVGSSSVSGKFTDLLPANTSICVTVLIVEDATGKTCKQTVCFPLPICHPGASFTGINTAEEVNSGNSILVNPNPAKEQTVITYTFTSGSNRSIAITDMYGRTVKVFKVVDDKGSNVLPTSTYSPGVYLVTGFSDNKLVDSRRLIIIK